VQPRSADLAFARSIHVGGLRVEGAKGRNGEAGEEPAMVTVVLVEKVVPTRGSSEHLQDRPHSSK